MPEKSNAIFNWSNPNVLTNWLLLGVLVITFGIYSPTLNYGFVNWDDDIYVIENSKVKNPSVENAISFFTEKAVANYHPVTMLSLVLNYRYSGLDAGSYHFVNLLFHLLNTLLLFWWMKLMTKNNLTISLISAVVFAIHPMHVESVAWVSGRKDVLYTFFYFLGLIGYCKYITHQRSKYLILVFLWYSLSLLSKPAAVVFPIHLLLLDYFLNREWNKKVIIEKVPFFAASLVIGWVTVQVQDNEGALNFDAFSILERMQLASYALMMYIIKFIAPIELSAFYPYPSRPFSSIYSFAILFCLVIAVCTAWYFKRKNKAIVFGILFFLAALVLVLQVITVGSTIIAERYTYLAYIGPAFILGYGIDQLKDYQKSFYKSAVVMMLISTIFMMPLTLKRVKVWENGEMLWSNVIEQFSSTAGAWGGRGAYYRKEKQYDKAIKDLNKAIQLNPNEAMFYSNRGNIYFDLQKNENALADYNHCLQLDQSDKQAYANRGAIYGRQKQWNLAIQDLSKAIEIDNNFFNAYMNRGFIYSTMGNHTLAAQDYALCAKLEPENHAIWNALAIEYQHLGDFNTSVVAFTNAIKYAPNIGLYYVNRAISYKRLNNKKQAIKDLNYAQKLGTSVDHSFYNGLEN